VPAGELLDDDQPAPDDPGGAGRVGVGGVLRRIDAVTFYPHTPEATDPPAVPPGTGRGRRVAQVTERSAPVTPAAPPNRPAGVSRQTPPRTPVRGQTA
jgi:hypothetical protein